MSASRLNIQLKCTRHKSNAWSKGVADLVIHELNSCFCWTTQLLRWDVYHTPGSFQDAAKPVVEFSVVFQERFLPLEFQQCDQINLSNGDKVRRFQELFNDCQDFLNKHPMMFFVLISYLFVEFSFQINSRATLPGKRDLTCSTMAVSCPERILNKSSWASSEGDRELWKKLKDSTSPAPHIKQRFSGITLGVVWQF